MNDPFDLRVKALLSRAISRCPKSRAQIAEELSSRLNLKITVAMLDAFTARTRRQHRFPLGWLIAFSEATGDFSVIREIARRSGFRLVTPKEAAIASRFLSKARAEQDLARMLEGGSE